MAIILHDKLKSTGNPKKQNVYSNSPLICSATDLREDRRFLSSSYLVIISKTVEKTIFFHIFLFQHSQFWRAPATEVVDLLLLQNKCSQKTQKPSSKDTLLILEIYTGYRRAEINLHTHKQKKWKLFFLKTIKECVQSNCYNQ